MISFNFLLISKANNVSNKTQSLVLDHLDLVDLVKFASIEPLRNYAVDVFHRRYKKPHLHISNDEENKRFYDRIFISNHDQALSMLKQFGSMISYVKLTFYNDSIGEVKEILSHVSEYCENLSRLSLRTSVEDALNDVKKPFKNVSDARFSGKLNKIGNDILSSDKMFPKVRRLHLDSFELNDGVNTFFPRLQLVYTEFPIDCPWSSEEAIGRLLASNPQMYGLTLINTKTSFLKFISQNLPRLERLRVENFVADYMYDIHFNQVNTFKITKLIGGEIGQFSFGHLEKFQCDPGNFPCIPFIQSTNSIHLRKLSLFTGIFSYYVSSNDLTLIMENIPNLIEATFNCGERLDVDTIIQFLNECARLERLTLHVQLGFPKDRIDDLKTRISNETLAQQWTLEKTYLEGLLITRNVRR